MLNLNHTEVYCIDGNFTKSELFKPIISFIEKTFTFKKIKYFSPENPCIKNTEYIKIDKINSSEEYSQFIISKLANFLNSDFTLTVHSDGFPINPECWTDKFLEYDFLGAAWPNQKGLLGLGFNGGFSLRSSKFIKTQTLIPKIYHTWHEDAVVTDICRPLFLSHGCRYSDVELAKQFSLELDLPNHHNDINKTFGFHYQKECFGKRIHKNLEINNLIKQIEQVKI